VNIITDVTITVGVDATQAEAEMAAIQTQADAVVKDWAEKRRTILSQVREAFTTIQSLISSFRMAMSLFGDQIHPFYDALFSIVASTVSLLLSVAAAFASSVILSPYAVVIAGIAIGLNILTTAKLIIDKATIMASFEDMKTQLSFSGQRSPIGGSF